MDSDEVERSANTQYIESLINYVQSHATEKDIDRRTLGIEGMRNLSAEELRISKRLGGGCRQRCAADGLALEPSRLAR